MDAPPFHDGQVTEAVQDMIWAAPRPACPGPLCGSRVIQADTGIVARSVPDAAALSTSRSVRMPARKELHDQGRAHLLRYHRGGRLGYRAIPWSLPSASAPGRRPGGAAGGVSHFRRFRTARTRRAETTARRVLQNSATVNPTTRTTAATASRTAGGSSRQTRCAPAREIVVGEVLQLVHQVEEPSAPPSIQSPPGEAVGAGQPGVADRHRETLSGGIHTPKAPCARGQSLLIFPRRGRKV